MEYQWDESKRFRNLAKHGVDFEAVETFDWETAIRFPDMRKPYGEERWLALGKIGERLHALVYTSRHDGLRVISLRKANNKELSRYDDVQTP